MRGREIAEKLGVTYQRVHQLTIRLHAQGRVTFGDPENPLRIVMRKGDKTPFLSRDEERVLSAIPREYVTDATKIRLAARMPENKVQKILEEKLSKADEKAKRDQSKAHEEDGDFTPMEVDGGGAGRPARSSKRGFWPSGGR